MSIPGVIPEQSRILCIALSQKPLHGSPLIEDEAMTYMRLLQLVRLEAEIIEKQLRDELNESTNNPSDEDEGS